MPSPKAEIRNFVVPFLILLPAAYVIWYLAGAWWLVPVRNLAELGAQWLYPRTVEHILQDGVFLLVAIDPTNAGGLPRVALNINGGGAFGAFKVYAPPLGAGVPLFFALALASGAAPLHHLLNLMMGGVVLMLGQALSIVVKIGATLFSEVPAFRPSDNLCSTDCYWALLFPVQYFTYLILPTLLAVVTWAVLYRRYLERLGPEVKRRILTAKGR
jgi:hypothetical protein